MKGLITYILLLFLLSSIFGCSEIRQASKTPECADLFTGIQEHFRYDSESQIFSMRIENDGYNLEYNLLRKESCLIGLSKRSIEKLFGNPSRANDAAHYYYLSPDCWKNKDGVGRFPCMQLVVKFDGNGKATEIQM